MMDFRTRLISALTELDRREERKPGHNRYALAHYLRAADGVVDARTFADAFTPTRGMRWVAKRMGFPLDVKRGEWVFLVEGPR